MLCLLSTNKIKIMLVRFLNLLRCGAVLKGSSKCSSYNCTNGGTIIETKRFCHDKLQKDQEQLTIVTEENGVRKITLNNPKKRNALSLSMLDKLKKDLTMDNHNLRCIVIRANGPVFSSGHDLKELKGETGKDYHEKVFKKCTEVMTILQKIQVPVIAEVRGTAAAAGCQLAASCDIVIATDNSNFSTPGASVGLFCSTPGIALSRAVPRKVAAYMLFTGHSISAEEAFQSGLVSKIVPDDKLETTTEEITEAILSKSKSVLSLGKIFYYQQLQQDVELAYEGGEKVMVANLGLKDAQEGISAFFEKRSPRWSHTTDK